MADATAPRCDAGRRDGNDAVSSEGGVGPLLAALAGGGGACRGAGDGDGDGDGAAAACGGPSSRVPARKGFPYWALFCEENTCLLLEALARRAPCVPDALLHAVFVSNAQRSVPFWNHRGGTDEEGEEEDGESPRKKQRGGEGGGGGAQETEARSPRGLRIWDYHVFGVQVVPGSPGGRSLVWDLDTRGAVGIPSAASEYLAATFRWGEAGWKVRDKYAPRFRVVPLATLRARFRSDRSHMRDQATGAWVSPPPPWEPLYGALSAAPAAEGEGESDGEEEGEEDGDGAPRPHAPVPSASCPQTSNLMSHFVAMDAPRGPGVVLDSIPALLAHLDALARGASAQGAPPTTPTS